MRIAVNTRLLLPGRLEGIGWFTFETLKRLTSQRPDIEFIFLFDRPFSKDFVFGENVKAVYAGPPSRHPILWWLWFEQTIPALLKKHKADLFLSPDGYASLRTKVPTVTVIHDINFEHYPKDLPYLIRKYYRYYTPLFAQKATRIATVSQYSKQDIATQYKVSPDKIDVVYNGCNENYAPIPEADQQIIRGEMSEGHPYFLFIGSLHPRKNLAKLFTAFDQFCKTANHPARLLIVGEKKWWTPEIRTAYEAMTHPDRVIFAGRLDPDHLKKVIASALAMVYVSYFEGFGIPIVEAFYSDVPVITSNVTSMPEIAGESALLVDPFSIDSIANAMERMAKEELLRKELIEKARIQREKFSWQKTTDRLWASLEKAIDTIP